MKVDSRWAWRVIVWREEDIVAFALLCCSKLLLLLSIDRLEMPGDSKLHENMLRRREGARYRCIIPSFIPIYIFTEHTKAKMNNARHYRRILKRGRI